MINNMEQIYLAIVLAPLIGSLDCGLCLVNSSAEVVRIGSPSSAWRSSSILLSMVAFKHHMFDGGCYLQSDLIYLAE